jgi:hypothetical protein
MIRVFTMPANRNVNFTVVIKAHSSHSHKGKVVFETSKAANRFT